MKKIGLGAICALFVSLAVFSYAQQPAGQDSAEANQKQPNKHQEVPPLPREPEMKPPQGQEEAKPPKQQQEAKPAENRKTGVPAPFERATETSARTAWHVRPATSGPTGGQERSNPRSTVQGQLR